MDELKNDISNFYTFLTTYSGKQKKQLSLLSDSWADFEQWRTMAKAHIFELLNYFPEPAPLDAKVLNVIEKNEFIQEEIEFNTAKNVRVKGTLLIPKGNGETFPAIIGIHDHGGFYYLGREKIIAQEEESDILKNFKKTYYGGRSWANEMVRKGYIVLSIDGFYFGSRKLDINHLTDETLESCPYKLNGLAPGTEEYIHTYNKMCGYFEALLVKHIFISGTTWPGILFHDDRACVDYLYTRKEVDIKRIGCCGLSIGGFRAAHLAALDSRISCTVVAGWMTSYHSLQWNRLRDHTYMIYIPNLTASLDLPDVVSLAAPNPLFIQQCSKDHLFHLDGMYEANSQIEKIYQRLGHSEKFKSQFYNNPHEFNLQMQEDAFSWFDQWMK
ncbi:dienelactone hydrolase family protein [Paenibacillus sp. GCM10027626]|uniref:dienelactone hydrolase family protein n=1 Tax=Paenibacillus sp. GCM10027626 TaxID=3273411 RepID=UPI003635B43F